MTMTGHGRSDSLCLKCLQLNLMEGKQTSLYKRPASFFPIDSTTLLNTHKNILSLKFTLFDLKCLLTQVNTDKLKLSVFSSVSGEINNSVVDLDFPNVNIEQSQENQNEGAGH